MKLFRQWLPALGLLLAGGLATSAWANVAVQGGDLGSGADPIQTYVVVGDTAPRDEAVSTSTIKTVLGFKLTSTAAAATCGIYDLASATSTLGQGGAGSNTKLGPAPLGLKDELYENTTNTTNIQMWPKPWRVTNGVVISVKNGVCTVYYQ